MIRIRSAPPMDIMYDNPGQLPMDVYIPNIFHGLAVSGIDSRPVQRKAAQKTRIPYLIYLNPESSFDESLSLGSRSFLLINQRKSPIAPKLQKNPQKNLPSNIVAGTVIMRIQKDGEITLHEKPPLNSAVNIDPSAANVCAKSPGIRMNEAICITLRAIRIILIFILPALFL